MPVESCQIGGRPGFRWGPEGTCYPYAPSSPKSRAIARGKATAQGMAISLAKRKATDVGLDVSTAIPILKISKAQRLITAVVLEPWDGDPATAEASADYDGDVLTAAEIEKAAHQFLREYNKATRLGLMHEPGSPPLELCESWVTRADLLLGGEVATKGTWLMTLYVACDVMWQQVESGDLDGLSIGATGSRRPVEGA